MRLNQAFLGTCWRLMQCEHRCLSRHYLSLGRMLQRTSGPADSGVRKAQPLPQTGHPGVVDTKNLWGHNWRNA